MLWGSAHAIASAPSTTKAQGPHREFNDVTQSRKNEQPIRLSRPTMSRLEAHAKLCGMSPTANRSIAKFATPCPHSYRTCTTSADQYPEYRTRHQLGSRAFVVYCPTEATCPNSHHNQTRLTSPEASAIIALSVRSDRHDFGHYRPSLFNMYLRQGRMRWQEPLPWSPSAIDDEVSESCFCNWPRRFTTIFSMVVPSTSRCCTCLSVGPVAQHG